MAKNEIIIFSRQEVALKFIEIPSVYFSEIKNIVEYQALKEFPYAKEEMVISFRNMGSYKEGFSYIMLAVAKKQRVKEIIGIKKKLPGSIRLETEILYLSFLKKCVIERDKITLIISICEDRSEVMVINGIKPVYSRGFRAGDSETLLREIKRSIICYQADRNNKEFETVSIIDSSNLAMDNIKFSLEEFLSIPVSFRKDMRGTDDLGMLLEIELLPGEYIDERVKREVVKQIFLTGSLFFITVFVLISFFMHSRP